MFQGSFSMILFFGIISHDSSTIFHDYLFRITSHDSRIISHDYLFSDHSHDSRILFKDNFPWFRYIFQYLFGYFPICLGFISHMSGVKPLYPLTPIPYGGPYTRRGSEIFFLFLKIRFWDELGPYGRWGAVKHVKIKFISMRAFLVSKKNLVFDPRRP